MYLFLGYLDGATRFAQSCGGGGTSSDLPWGRNPDEDDRRLAYGCMMQAHRMMRPSQPKRGIGTDGKGYVKTSGVIMDTRDSSDC
jgi:hypothetical protein